MCGPTITKGPYRKDAGGLELGKVMRHWKKREKWRGYITNIEWEGRGNKQECKHHPEAGKGQETNSCLNCRMNAVLLTP